MNRRQDERGQAGGVEALVFGFLILLLGTLIVANAWAVVDAKFAADGAAREGAHTYVEEGLTADEAAGPARQAVDAALSSLHRPGTVEVEFGQNGHQRCQPVTVRVRTRVAILRLPFVRPAGGHVEVSGSHT